MRVLLIEDDRNNSRSIELMLKSEGYECDAADTGEAGVARGQDHFYDVIILDLMLPDMDGYEVVRRLRAAKVATPILILSGLSELDSKVKGLEIGADDYITKPFERHELVARLQALVRRSMGYSAVPGGEGGGDLLARKGEAAPWSFAMAYTPYGEDPGAGRGEAPDGPAPAAASISPPRRTAIDFARADAGPPAETPGPRSQPEGGGHIIVLGNEKGGTGKSTTAMHLIVALMREGLSVAGIDLDTRQGTLSRYLDNRRSAAARHGWTLPIPDRHAAGPAEATPEALEERLDRLARTCDVVVVDTPGNDTPLSRLAHAWADTLITPINDSLVDLDVLARVDAESLEVVEESPYSGMVREIRAAREARGEGALDWVVLRNRLSTLDARNKQAMAALLPRLGERLGFRQGPGLSERVIYRELFLNGLTLLDLRDADVGVAFTMSHVAARQELRALIEAVRPAPKDAGAPAEPAEPRSEEAALSPA